MSKLRLRGTQSLFRRAREATEQGLTRLVPVPVGVHDLVAAEPAEGTSAVEVLQRCPEELPIPAVDQAADEGLLEPTEKQSSSGLRARRPTIRGSGKGGVPGACNNSSLPLCLYLTEEKAEKL